MKQLKQWCDDIKQCFSDSDIKKAKEKAEQIDCHTRPYLYHITSIKGMVNLLKGKEVVSEMEDIYGKKESILWTSKRPITYYASEDEKLKILIKIKPDKNDICQIEGRYIQDNDWVHRDNTRIPPLKEQIIDCERIEALKKCQKCDISYDNVRMAHSLWYKEDEVILIPKKKPWALKKDDISAISPSFYSDTNINEIATELVKNGLYEFLPKIKIIEQYCPGSMVKVSSYKECNEKCFK